MDFTATYNQRGTNTYRLILGSLYLDLTRCWIVDFCINRRGFAVNPAPLIPGTTKRVWDLFVTLGGPASGPTSRRSIFAVQQRTQSHLQNNRRVGLNAS